MTESFEDAIKALRHIARGNGSVLRIADRIVAAHERELAAAKLAAEMPTYDVDGNERHKAACELRDMKIGKLSTHWDFVCSLAARLNIPRPNDEPYEDYELHELIRDKLVDLLEGECNFSTPESYMACEDGDPNPAETSPDEQTSVTLGTRSPITGELRGAWMVQEADTWMFDKERFTQLCDAIDSIHATLEYVYDELRMKYVNINRHAQHVERENESLKTELDRVLREHGNRDDLLQLPLDADRVPIFIGDVMESDYITRTEVVAVGIKCFFAWSNIDRRWHQYEASQFRHHQPDTWERIIEDVLQRGHDDYPLNVDTEPYVARCKALAGDAE